MENTMCYVCSKNTAVNLPSGNTSFCSEECEQTFSDDFYPTTTEFRELRYTHHEMTQRFKYAIKTMAAQYVGKYPTWQYAEALAKDMNEINWEEEYTKEPIPFDRWNGRVCKWCAAELINDERGVCERCATHIKSQQDDILF